MADIDVEKIQENIKKADKKLDDIQKNLEGKVGADDLKALNDTIDSIKDSVASIENVKVDDKEIKLTEYIKNIQEHVNTVEKDVKTRLLEMGQKPKTLLDKVKDLTLSDEWKNHTKDLQKSGAGRRFVMEKAANDLLTTDWTADTGAVGLPQLQIPGVTKHPWRQTPIFAAVPKRTVGMEHQVSYTEELSRSDAAALKAEGSAYAQSGATWITKVLSFFDIGHYVRVTRESLEDAEYIQQEMNDLLSNGLLRAIEVLLYEGAGTTTIEGVSVSAKTFAKPTGVASVSSATMRDCLLAAKLQVKRGYMDSDSNKMGYMANMALIGPSSAYNVVTEKDEIGRVIVENIDGWRPGGMAVVESFDTTETAGQKDFLVGDFNKAMLYLKRNLTIETGLDADDFTKGQITIRASIRGNLLIKALEKYAFVLGDFVTAPGLIEA